MVVKPGCHDSMSHYSKGGLLQIDVVGYKLGFSRGVQPHPMQVKYQIPELAINPSAKALSCQDLVSSCYHSPNSLSPQNFDEYNSVL